MSVIANNQPLSRPQLLTYVGALSSIAMLSACTAPILVIQPETIAFSDKEINHETQ